MSRSFNHTIAAMERESLQFQALTFFAEKLPETQDGQMALEKLRKIAGLEA
jgi:hypothetical protein